MIENRFKLQSALDGNYLQIALPGLIQLDDIAVKVMKEDCPNFLIPFQMVTMNDELTLKYKLTNSVALAYSNMTMTKEDFINFYIGMLEPFLQASDWFMDYHYICINNNYVYLGRDMIHVNYLYIPEKDFRNTDEAIIDFFKDILNHVTITDDNNILLLLYQYFSKGAVTLTELYQILKENRNMIRPQSETVKQQNIEQLNEVINQGQAQVETSKQEKPLFSRKKESSLEEKQEVKITDAVENSSEDDVMKALFGDKPKKKEKSVKKKEKKEENHLFSKALFGKKKESQIQETVPEEIKQNQISVERTPSVSMEVYDNPQATDVTVIADDCVENAAYLDLIESANQGAIQRISLDFPGEYITLGRQSGDLVQPTIAFDKSMKQISRMHLRIEKKQNQYYAIDLGSANHSFLNGQKMIPNMPYELKSGMELMLAFNAPIRYRVII